MIIGDLLHMTLCILCGLMAGFHLPASLRFVEGKGLRFTWRAIPGFICAGCLIALAFVPFADSETANRQLLTASGSEAT